MRKIIIILMLGIFLIASASALQDVPISYIQKVSYTPNCAVECSNQTSYVGNTTYTDTNCTSTCKPVFEIGLMFTGDDNFRSINIDTANTLYKNGSDFIIPGVYMATLGNNSDVTGINEKILNLTSVINNKLAECYTDNMEIQANETRKIQACEDERNSMNMALSQRNDKINGLEKYKGQRWLFAVLGIALGIFILKVFLPYTKEHIPRRDPNESGHSPYLGQS